LDGAELKEEEIVKLKRPYLTIKEMDRIITLSHSPRDRLILRLLSRTGIRIGELLALRVEDIDFEKRTLLIEAEKSKKEKRRLVPVDQGTLNGAQRYLGERKEGKVFEITRQRIDQIIKDLGEKAGVESVLDFYTGSERKLHAHTFRHSFAVNWIKTLGSGKLVELSKHLGHQSIETTMIYLRFSPEAVHEAYDKLWK